MDLVLRRASRNAKNLVWVEALCASVTASCLTCARAGPLHPGKKVGTIDERDRFAACELLGVLAERGRSNDETVASAAMHHGAVEVSDDRRSDVALPAFALDDVFGAADHEHEVDAVVARPSLPDDAIPVSLEQVGDQRLELRTAQGM